jgi:hypothetical protein
MGIFVGDCNILSLEGGVGQSPVGLFNNFSTYSTPNYTAQKISTL